MPVKRLFLVFVLCFFSVAVSAGQSDASRDTSVAANELDAALQSGIDDPAIPFQLQVNCVDQKGIRSLELFAGGATIWNGRSQLVLPAEARSTLLANLLSQGFAKFESHYGGHGQPEKTGAAARMTCRIHVEIDGLQKTSSQQAGGEQSTAFAGLATRLLDVAERYEKSGITPGSLQDALDKLASGLLAPQILKLRFVNLPGDGVKKDGSILRVKGGEASRQAYSPGRSIGSQVWQPLDHGQYSELVETLRATQLESLPGNLYSNDQLDFEIQVLGHKKVVISRPFTRLEADSQVPAQQRFDALVRALGQLDL